MGIGAKLADADGWHWLRDAINRNVGLNPKLDNYGDFYSTWDMRSHQSQVKL